MRIPVWPRVAASSLCLAVGLVPGARAGSEASSEPAPAVIDRPHAVQAPWYGVALFDFYRGKYFSAIADLQVAEHFSRLGSHDEEARILRGVVLLSYGQDADAEAIFQQVIANRATPSAQARAWYYLARIRYERGRYEQALEDLSRVSAPLPPELEGEGRVLRGNLLLALGRGEEAVAALQAAELASAIVTTTSLYQRYNLAIAMQGVGRTQAAQALLDALGSVATEEREQKDIRDRANLSLGLLALRDQHFAQARHALERVRLDGPFSNRALLAYGWAGSGLANATGALSAWQELVDRSPKGLEHLEAAMAIGRQQAAVGSYPAALGAYGLALAEIEEADARLLDAQAAVQSGEVVDRLIAVNPDDELGWMRGAARLPDFAGAVWMNAVFSGFGFQERFKAYRDIRFLGRSLDQWHERLEVLRDMLANRRQAFANRLSALDIASRQDKLDEARRSAAALRQTLDDATRDGDGVAFADKRESALARRLERDRALIGEIDPDSAARVSDRLRRVEGALTWRLQQGYAPRQWATQKELTALGRQIDLAQGRIDAMHEAASSQPARMDDFARRIDALQQDLERLRPDLSRLEAALRQDVEARLLEGIARHQAAVHAYADQTRFALAQVRDFAAHGQAPGAEASGTSQPGHEEPAGAYAH